MKHTFALYLTNIFYHSKITSTELVIKDKGFYHRLEAILRLNVNDQIILFDERFHATCTITFMQKNSITLSLSALEKNVVITPHITLYQCLTKKTTFEEIVYIAAALGITKIFPLITQKIHANWWQEKTIERLTNIAISGCEQAKNFVLPVITNPIKLTENIPFDPQGQKILFEPTGQKLPSVVGQNKNSRSLEVVIGPEGGLTESELAILNTRQFIPCALTPTILRSIDAVTVGLGCIRVLL